MACKLAMDPTKIINNMLTNFSKMSIKKVTIAIFTAPGVKAVTLLMRCK